MKKGLALITGATSGIGKEYSFKLSKMGYDLIIVGRRRELLEKNAQFIREKYNINVEILVLDLTNKEDTDEFIDLIDKNYKIDFLVNNAGYGAEESFLLDNFENQLNMLKVHNLVVMKLCHLIGNKMKENNKGTIINVSSLAAFIQTAESAMYCSTKRFLVTFSECLAMELNKYGIKVQCLCPGFTRTDFHSKLKMEESKLRNKGIVRWMTAEEVVNYSIKRLNKTLKVIVIPGIFNRIIYNILKFIPKAIYYRVATKGWELIE